MKNVDVWFLRRFLFEEVVLRPSWLVIQKEADSKGNAIDSYLTSMFDL